MGLWPRMGDHMGFHTTTMDAVWGSFLVQQAAEMLKTHFRKVCVQGIIGIRGICDFPDGLRRQIGMLLTDDLSGHLISISLDLGFPKERGELADPASLARIMDLRADVLRTQEVQTMKATLAKLEKLTRSRYRRSPTLRRLHRGAQSS